MSKESILKAGRPSRQPTAAATLASLADEQDMKRVNFHLSAEKHRKFKALAAERGTTIRDLMTAYIDELISSK